MARWQDGKMASDQAYEYVAYRPQRKRRLVRITAAVTER